MKVYSYESVVVGTGAAGYNAACRLKKGGKRVCIITENTEFGTSRNTGSDKQTYYKLTLSGDAPDSVRKMAENLFSGGSTDGDNALCEAALSVRCFMNLCELGVEFPTNRYGEYVGYKTDHDQYARATSVGPLTSKYMTVALEKQAKELGIEIFDDLLAIEILKNHDGVLGLLCLERTSGEFVAFKSANIVLCTGGPAGVYADSVYPTCHTGSSGIALCAGAAAQNLTEWQYGLASLSPRWNVSGSYMQVLPRLLSTDDGENETEFLSDFFDDPYEALSALFLKGYQWPFDCQKALSGSSLIDILVYRERTVKKRRVYLDFTKNPFGLSNIDYSRLSEEASSYLKKAGAAFGTPYERLLKLNAPAAELYKSKGVDLSKEYLEIALCAQHHNGGIAVDKWWQTRVKGLFAAGECAGTHGVVRPGGSALNAGQVGSLRAAEYILHSERTVSENDFKQVLAQREQFYCEEKRRVLSNPDNAEEIMIKAGRQMSDIAGAIRIKDQIKAAIDENSNMLKGLEYTVGVGDISRFFLYYKLKDTLITRGALLYAMLNYIEKIGKTRGSSLCHDEHGTLREGLDEIFRFSLENKEASGLIQETTFNDDNKSYRCMWRAVRPIPEEDSFFENVWRLYRENKNVY